MTPAEQGTDYAEGDKMAPMNAVSVFEYEAPADISTTAAHAAGKTRWLTALATAMALLVALTGVLVLCGWYFGNQDLISVLPGRAAMKPNTAICFILSGAALLLGFLPQYEQVEAQGRRHRLNQLSLLFSGCVLGVGLLTLLEFLLHADFGIDQTFFKDHGQLTAPGRMAMITAVNFSVTGCALLLLKGSAMTRAVARALAGTVLVASFLSVVGYLYGVPLLFGGSVTEGYVSMAVHTGFSFMLLSVAILFADRDSAVVVMLSADAAGSRLARTLLPVVILLPVLLGWFCLQLAAHAGGAGFGMAVLAVTLVSSGVATVWLVAVFLNRAERQQGQLTAVRASSHAALRRSEQELRLVTDQLPALLSYIDTSGRFIRVNRTYESWHARPMAEIVGHNIRELMGAEYWESTRTARDLAFAGEIVSFEAAYPAAAGERQVQVTYSPDLDEDGQVRGLACMVLDVDEQRKAETALRQTEKLAVVGRLASSIAHEINNPLEAVTNLLYLAGTEMEGNAALTEYVTLAQQELARVTQIVTQTLRFHRQATYATSITPADLLGQVLVLYQGRLTGAGVTVERSFKDMTEVLCREGEVRQVLANLVGNAVDAMPRGGRLRLRTRRVRDWATGRDGVSLLVADTGHGIPDSVRAKLYEPFQTTKGDRGSGLGLWVSKEIVDRHGGSLRVSSSAAPGASGTVFRLWLPLVPDSAVAG